MLLTGFHASFNWHENSPDLEDLSRLFEDFFDCKKLLCLNFP